MSVRIHFPQDVTAHVLSYLNSQDSWRDAIWYKMAAGPVSSWLSAVSLERPTKRASTSSVIASPTEAVFDEYAAEYLSIHMQHGYTPNEVHHQSKTTTSIVSGAVGLSGHAVVLAPSFAETEYRVFTKLLLQFKTVTAVAYSRFALKECVEASLPEPLRARVKLLRVDLTQRFSSIDATKRNLPAIIQEAAKQKGSPLSPAEVGALVIARMKPLYQKLAEPAFPSVLFGIPPADYVVSPNLASQLPTMHNRILLRVLPEINQAPNRDDFLGFAKQCILQRHVLDLASLGGRVSLIDTETFIKRRAEVVLEAFSMYDPAFFDTIQQLFHSTCSASWDWTMPPNSSDPKITETYKVHHWVLTPKTPPCILPDAL